MDGRHRVERVPRLVSALKHEARCLPTRAHAKRVPRRTRVGVEEDRPRALNYAQKQHACREQRLWLKLRIAAYNEKVHDQCDEPPAISVNTVFLLQVGLSWR